MAIPTDADQKRISASTHSPSRSSAVANKSNDLPNAVTHIDIVAPSSAGDINIRRNVYTLTIPPNATNVPNPQIGDKALVYLVDSAQAVNPYRYEEYHYTSTAALPTPSWRKVTYA